MFPVRKCRLKAKTSRFFEKINTFCKVVETVMFPSPLSIDVANRTVCVKNEFFLILLVVVALQKLYLL